MITDRMTMITGGEDGGYPELGDKKRSGLVMNSKSFPKRSKVSAVRDFPVAFQQLNGQSDSQKESSANHDVPDAFKHVREKRVQKR